MVGEPKSALVAPIEIETTSIFQTFCVEIIPAAHVSEWSPYADPLDPSLKQMIQQVFRKTLVTEKGPPHGQDSNRSHFDKMQQP